MIIVRDDRNNKYAINPKMIFSITAPVKDGAFWLLRIHSNYSLITLYYGTEQNALKVFNDIVDKLGVSLEC